MPNRQNPDPDEINKALHDKEGWPEYRRLVLAKQDDLAEAIEKLDGKVEDIRGDVTTLKVKAAAWGFVAGSVSAIGAAVLQYLTRGGH